MKVLVACEESQAVTRAFRALGHEAYSCDLQPCSGGHPEWHILGSALDQLERDWDLILAFPPCTDLAVSGARYFAQKRADGRQQKAIEFFMAFANAKCPRIVIENPVGIMSSKWRKPDQIIQPWQFGHPESKATCLWLKGLPLLRPTNILPKPASGRWDNQTPSGQNKLGPSPERAKLRSKTYAGIAVALADQFGNVDHLWREDFSCYASQWGFSCDSNVAKLVHHLREESRLKYGCDYRLEDVAENKFRLVKGRDSDYFFPEIREAAKGFGVEIV